MTTTDLPRTAQGTAAKIAELARRREVARQGARSAVEKQHAKGKLTARERIDAFLDPGSFVEVDEFARHGAGAYGDDTREAYGDGVVTGYGLVDGRPVCVYAQDFTVFGGSVGERVGQKIVKVMQRAIEVGCPIVGLNDSGGARIQEGVASLAAYGEIGYHIALASGVVPQISLILGPCAGGAVYGPAATDVVVMVENTSHQFVTGPDVVRAVTGEDVTFEELGGPAANAEAGNVHYVATDEQDALDWVQSLLSYLPSNNLDEPPDFGAADLEISADDLALNEVVPDEPNRLYDMRRVVRHVVDDGEFLELQAAFAPNLLVGLARIEGRTVGVVANQPLHLSGALDIDASEKGARFIQFCDAFNIPILTLVDVPGYFPGLAQERGGIIRRGVKLSFAYATATVPMVTVIVRKAYGGGYASMGCKHYRVDANLAWPTAEIAVMGGEAAVSVLFRRQLQEAAATGDVESLHAALVAAYREQRCTPYEAAERGYVDAVIAPSETRTEVAKALRMLRTKRQASPARKHTNFPL
ncbi:acyl-CoA carboxylase subunit beta [Cryptosporangium arvum]|uniref:Acetyl-CoA carboxylase, carboxyltransferase component (Subunits alpha and beta) n=1 Tax=Cryptosporangium arvum DSM 44712 TaxID=927661 RepID=A0A010ZS93_9ACTN|nr:acyl-CoA carboxylase subunit beta [Cryptosporangium arvum]EXG80092.1 acetyl-CoA carboxylase, carboxyltransferase component (subunits alpha and beta) [Cryptosporangium arvum DSM 44712]